MTDRQGQTTLFFAAEVGRTEVVRYLLDHGADAAVVDDMGRSALDVAKGAGRGRDEARVREIVTLLTQPGRPQ